MTRLFVIQAVMVGILVPTGTAHARGPAPKAVKANREQGRPLWSLCEPRSKRVAAAIPLKGERQGPVAPTAEIAPSWSDCEGIEGVERAVFDSPAKSGGDMSSQFDDDDEAPLCDGGTRCSPVPTERQRSVSGITVAKAIAPPARGLSPISDSYKAPPAAIGSAADGYPSAPFVPPQPVA